MIWVAGIAGGLLLVYGLMMAFAHASPARVKAVAIGLAVGLLVGTVVLLLVGGRLPQALGAAAVLIPVALRWRQAVRAARGFTRRATPTPGQSSGVSSDFVEMRLDHDTGQMTGRVRRGRFSGRELGDLALIDLLDLRDEASGDTDSLALIEAWLDRAHPDWRSAAPPPPGSGPMTRVQALEVLGLAEGATEEEIRAAHRRLMASAHPDRGGSDWLAARINQARDVLLG